MKRFIDHSTQVKNMKGRILLLLISIVACCFFAGCTGSAELSDLNSAGTQSNTIPPSPSVTYTVVPTTAIPTATIPPTAVPTKTYSVPAKVVPEFSAGDIVVTGDGSGYTLITKLDSTIGKYSYRLLRGVPNEFKLNKDATFEEMGPTDYFSDFDNCKFKYEYYDTVGTYENVKKIPIYNSQSKLYGYLYYDTPTSMEFKFA